MGQWWTRYRDTGVDKTLKDLEGDTQLRDGSIGLWIPWGVI